MMLRTLALSAALLVAAPAQSAEPAADDRTALLQLADRMDQAWNAADADANADLFAIDATGRFGEDPLGVGRDALRNQFRAFFKGRPPGLRHVTKIERIDQLSANLAMWDAEVTIQRAQPAGGWTTLTRIRSVTILVKRRDGWRVRSVRAFPVS